MFVDLVHRGVTTSYNGTPTHPVKIGDMLRDIAVDLLTQLLQVPCRGNYLRWQANFLDSANRCCWIGARANFLQKALKPWSSPACSTRMFLVKLNEVMLGHSSFDFFKVASTICPRDPCFTIGRICIQSPLKTVVSPPKSSVEFRTSCNVLFDRLVDVPVSHCYFINYEQTCSTKQLGAGREVLYVACRSCMHIQRHCKGRMQCASVFQKCRCNPGDCCSKCNFSLRPNYTQQQLKHERLPSSSTGVQVEKASFIVLHGVQNQFVKRPLFLR